LTATTAYLRSIKNRASNRHRRPTSNDRTSPSRQTHRAYPPASPHRHTPTQYPTIVDDPQHRAPTFQLSSAHIRSSVHPQLSILPLWKTLNTVHHHSTSHLHTYFAASTPNSVYYHCGRPSTPYTIIPPVICTHNFQRPPPTQYPTMLENPQHRRFHSPRRTSAPPHFAQNDTN
jgi:hypothetical protein